MRKKGDRSRDILHRDDAVMSSLTRPYELVIDHGEGSTVYDVDGNSYLDFAAGVSVMNIGYNCQKIKDAVCTQMEKMVHCGFSDFCAEMPVKLAEKLCRMTGYEKVFLSNSGAEAVEAAMKLAFWHSRRKCIIAFYQAFHGLTLSYSLLPAGTFGEKSISHL